MRAKLKITSVAKQVSGETLTLSAVYKSGAYPEDGADEDNTFAMFTPQADLVMHINNPALVGKFEPGQKFYVDFSSADVATSVPPPNTTEATVAIEIIAKGLTASVNFVCPHCNQHSPVSIAVLREPLNEVTCVPLPCHQSNGSSQTPYEAPQEIGVGQSPHTPEAQG